MTTPLGSAGTRSSSPTPCLGLFAGLLAAGVCLKLAEFYPDWAENGAAYTFVFGISAMSLLFLSLGLSFPVTHHITIIGGLAALKFLPIVGGHPIPAMLIGAVGGMCSAWWRSCSRGSGTTTATPTSTLRPPRSGR